MYSELPRLIGFYLDSIGELLKARITSEAVVEPVYLEFKRKTIAFLYGFLEPQKRFLLVSQTSIDSHILAGRNVIAVFYLVVEFCQSVFGEHSHCCRKSRALICNTQLRGSIFLFPQEKKLGPLGNGSFFISHFLVSKSQPVVCAKRVGIQLESVVELIDGLMILPHKIKQSASV